MDMADITDARAIQGDRCKKIRNRYFLTSIHADWVAFDVRFHRCCCCRCGCRHVCDVGALIVSGASKGGTTTYVRLRACAMQ